MRYEQPCAYPEWDGTYSFGDHEFDKNDFCSICGTEASHLWLYRHNPQFYALVHILVNVLEDTGMSPHRLVEAAELAAEEHLNMKAQKLRWT